MILRVIDVVQKYRSGFWLRPIQVLHEVSLQVERGKVFGFVGPNGAGKTTLIQLIVGIRKPTSGQILIEGLPSTSVEARAKIGYLPERPYFYEHMTGEEILFHFGTLSGMSRSQVKKRIDSVLDQVGMKESRRIELKRYSKGMLQRIGIAQAILHDPDLLVLDEPMSGLDPIGRKEIRELITRLSSEGRTIFFSSHIIPDVEAICDEVGWIQNGKVMGAGPIGDFLKKGELKTEIAFRGVELEKVNQIKSLDSIRSIPNAQCGLASGLKAVNSALSDLISLGAEILWVQPVRPSLEELFIDASQDGDPS